MSRYPSDESEHCSLSTEPNAVPARPRNPVWALVCELGGGIWAFVTGACGYIRDAKLRQENERLREQLQKAGDEHVALRTSCNALEGRIAEAHAKTDRQRHRANEWEQKHRALTVIAKDLQGQVARLDRARLDAKLVHTPQGRKRGLAAIVGQWPGNETDEEIEEWFAKEKERRKEQKPARRLPTIWAYRKRGASMMRDRTVAAARQVRRAGQVGDLVPLPKEPPGMLRERTDYTDAPGREDVAETGQTPTSALATQPRPPGRQE